MLSKFKNLFAKKPKSKTLSTARLQVESLESRDLMDAGLMLFNPVMTTGNVGVPKQPSLPTKQDTDIHMGLPVLNSNPTAKVTLHLDFTSSQTWTWLHDAKNFKV